MLRSMITGSMGRFSSSLCSFLHRSYCLNCQPLLRSRDYQGLLRSAPFTLRSIASKKRKPPPPPPPISTLVHPKTSLPSPSELLEKVNGWLTDLATKNSFVLKASDFYQSLQAQQVFELVYDPTISTEQNYYNLSKVYACWMISTYLVESKSSAFKPSSSAIGTQIMLDIITSCNLPKYQNIEFSVLVSEIIKDIMSQKKIRSRLNIALVVFFEVHALYLQQVNLPDKQLQMKELYDNFFNAYLPLVGKLSQELSQARIVIMADVIFGTLQRQQRPDLTELLEVNSSLDIRMYDDTPQSLVSYQPFTVTNEQAQHLNYIISKYFSSEDCIDNRMIFLRRAGDLGFSEYVFHFIKQTCKERTLLLGTTVFNNAILSQALQGKHEHVKELVNMIHDEFEQYHDFVSRKWQYDRYQQRYDDSDPISDSDNKSTSSNKERWEKKPHIGIRFITFDYYLCGISHFRHQPLRHAAPITVQEQGMITRQIVNFLNSLPIDPPADTFESIACVIDGFDDEELFHRVIDKYCDWLEFLQQQETIWMVGKNDTTEMKQVQQVLKDEKRLELQAQREYQSRANQTSLKLRKQAFELNQTKTIDIFTRNLIRLNCAHEARELVDRVVALDVKINPATITIILQRMRQSNHARNLQHVFKSIPTKFKVARQYEHAVELTHLLFQTGQLYHGARGFNSIYQSIENKLQTIQNDVTFTQDERYYAVEQQLLFLVSILKKMLKYLKGAKNTDKSKHKRLDEDIATNVSLMIMELLLKHLPPESWSRQHEEVKRVDGYATIHKRLINVLRHFKRLCWHAEDADYVFRTWQQQLESPRIHDIITQVNDIVKFREERQLLFEQKREAEKG